MPLALFLINHKDEIGVSISNKDTHRISQRLGLWDMKEVTPQMLGYITTSPTFRTFKYEKKQAGKHETIPPQTMKKFIKCLEQEALHHRLFYSLPIETGMGRAECASLKWQDVDSLQLPQKLKQQLYSTKKDDDYVFAQPNGKAMLPSSFTYRLKLICQKHVLEGVTMRAIQNTVRGHGDGKR